MPDALRADATAPFYVFRPTIIAITLNNSFSNKIVGISVAINIV
jgi:hypothetical protein